MNISFENKRVLVTGAGRGIGREIARAFAKAQAAKVFALSRTKAHLDTLVAEEPRITPVVADLSDWKASMKVVESLGPIDILVNNAAVLIREPFLDITAETYDLHFDTNLKSLIMISQVVVRGMVERKQGGSIVNISSRLSQMGAPNHALYSATKGALDAWTYSMAVEFGPHQIRVNCVNPGLTNTDMAAALSSNPQILEEFVKKTPLGRIAEPEDVARVVLFVASEKASMIHGHTLPVAGGF